MQRIVFFLAVLLFCITACSNPTDTASATIPDASSKITMDPGQELNPSLSPDGSSVVFEKLTAPGNSDIYLLKGGGTAENLTKDSMGNDNQPEFSPDGQSIAFRSSRDGGGIFVMSVSGGAAKKIVDEGFNPSWSPDGKQIFYDISSAANSPYGAATTGVVWMANVDSGEKKQISKGYALEPRMSPHGQRIAFWGLERDGKFGTQRDIWTMKADGSDLVSVTNDKAVDWSPVWSPDGKYLYFASDRDGTMKIWRTGIDENTGKTNGDAELVSKDGGAPVRGQISISNNGKLTYIDASVTRSLFKANFDPVAGKLQGDAAPVTNASISPTDFDISPDGQWVAFITGDNKQEDVYVIKADGTGLKQLTNDPFRDRTPRWTPDGKKIAFRSDRPTDTPMGNYQYYLINPDGAGLQRITSTAGSNAATIEWSPDGKKAVIGPNFATGGMELYTLNADGSEPQKIAATTNTFSNIVWSPDSKKLTYRESKNAQGRAFMLTIGAAKAEPLPEMNFAPLSWSEDGKTIAGNQVFSDKPALTMLYTPGTMKYEALNNVGGGPQLLNDGKRMIITIAGGSKVQLLDRTTKTAQDLITVALPGTLGPALSKDNKAIFYLMSKAESDIYQMGK